MPDGAAVDTNVLIASLIVDHEHHGVANQVAAEATHVLGQVAVEAWSVLRRRFRLPADTVASLLMSYVDDRTMVAPSALTYDTVLRTGQGIGLAGNVHDAVIVRTAAEAALSVTTLDVGLHRLADGIIVCRLLATGTKP